MTASNNAHDEIKPLDDAAERNVVRARIGEGNALKVYDLVVHIHEAGEKGSATLSSKTLIYQHNQNDQIQIQFPIVSVTKAGWLHDYPQMQKSMMQNAAISITYFSLQGLANEDNPIKLHRITPVSTWSLADLIEQMEHRGVGRPSTYASIINNLEKENGYIDIDPETDQVRLTERGLRVAAILQHNAPLLSSAHYTARLNSDIEAIQRGEKSPRDVILQVYEDCFGEKARSLVEDIIWDNIDSLYEPTQELGDNRSRGYISRSMVDPAVDTGAKNKPVVSES